MNDEQERGLTAADGIGRQIAHTGELAQAAAAARETAAIQAAYTVAINRPRDIDDARARILNTCKRARFAEAALYSKPIGRDRIQGLSVRFAEEAARLFGNIIVFCETTFEDDDIVCIRVGATDLESNATHATSLTIKKVIERRSDADRIVLGKRTNSKGDIVFIVRPTEDELANLIGARMSKIKRNHILALLPADIKEDAELAIHKVIASRVDADPDAEKKRIIEAFAMIGVKPSALKDALGHSLDIITASELETMRGWHAAIKNEEISWHQIVTEIREAKAEAMPEAKPAKRRSEEPPSAPVNKVEEVSLEEFKQEQQIVKDTVALFRELWNLEHRRPTLRAILKDHNLESITKLGELDYESAACFAAEVKGYADDIKAENDGELF